MKNIILIITDTFRFDNLGQGSTVKTPMLDGFASERAVSMERFYTGSYPTIPHRTDLASGVLGWPHHGWQPIGKSGPNHIAKLLSDAGYATQLICDSPHLFESGFQDPFDGAYQHRGQEGDTPLLHLNDEIEEVMPPDKTRISPSFRGHTLVDRHRWTNRYYEGEYDTFAAKIGHTTVRWLEENYRAGPFFLWVDLFDPHEPWDPPEYMVRRYDPDYKGVPMLHPNYGRSSDYTAPELKNLHAHYAAEAELVDRYIGRILEKIEDLKLFDESLVIVTSDHGICLGEHGRTGKSNISALDDRFWPLYPEINHVPFLIAGGGIEGGRSSRAMAQPVDILPTVMDLAGVDATPSQPFDGLSFAEVLTEGKLRHRDYTVSGTFLRAADGRVPKHAVTPFLITDEWGYAPVGSDGEPELYNLPVDGRAETDVSASNSSVLEGLNQLLTAHLRDHGAEPEFYRMWIR